MLHTLCICPTELCSATQRDGHHFGHDIVNIIMHIIVMESFKIIKKNMLHPATYLIRGLNSLCSCNRFCRWTHPPLQQWDREGSQYDLCWVVDQKWDGEEGEVGLTSKDNLHHWDACGSKQGAGWMDGWGWGSVCV